MRKRYGWNSAEQAYREACLAPHAGADHAWSHPAVYHAAVATSRYVLANEVQSVAFPQFDYHYSQLCRRVMRGESLGAPVTPALQAHSVVPLSAEASRVKLKALRTRFDL